jgi:hypothetical protein
MDVGDQEQMDHFMGLYEQADEEMLGKINKD